jgi:competence ComEA-like helix-hairpin-helix protein
MTSTERNSLLLLFGLGVVGHGVRLWSMAPEEAPGGISILSQLPPGDISIQRARALRAGRPLADGERIDLNLASAEEIARLPRIGLVGAKALVRARQREGGFASFDDLDRLPGIGPGLLASIADHVTLGDTTRAHVKRDQAKPAGRVAVFGSPPPPPQVGPLVVRRAGTKRRRFSTTSQGGRFTSIRRRKRISFRSPESAQRGPKPSWHIAKPTGHSPRFPTWKRCPVCRAVWYVNWGRKL